MQLVTRFTYFWTLLVGGALVASACAEGAPSSDSPDATGVLDIRESDRTDGSSEERRDDGSDDPVAPDVGGDSAQPMDASGEDGSEGDATPVTCSSEEDCGGSDACRVDRTGDDIRTYCGAPNRNGSRLGASCSNDSECRSNLCLDGVCTRPCERPVQCDKKGWTCENADVPTNNGSTEKLNVCRPAPAKECRSDGDCSAGDRCVAKHGKASLEFRCTAPNANGGSIGASCSKDGDCLHNLCVDGRCAPPCTRNANCSMATDYRCKTTSVQLQSGNTDSASICLPPRTCDERDQCKVNQFCYVDRKSSSSAGTCRDPNPGGGSLGEVCQKDAQCNANLCFSSRFRQICSLPCRDNSDCKRAGFRCEETAIGDGSGGTRQEKICVPVPPKECDAQGECTRGRSCAVVVQADGSGLESVCIPDPGGQGTGNACSNDEQCNSKLCLNGDCADPCIDRSQCAANQVCSTEAVTKRGESGQFDVCKTLGQEECTLSGSCSDNVRICSRLQSTNNSIRAYCRFPDTTGSSKPLGASCSSLSACRSGLCLSEFAPNSPFAGECSAVCRRDSQCAVGQDCTSLPYQNTDVAVCAKSCQANGDCSASNTCQFNEDRTGSSSSLDSICMEAPGTKQLGASCSSHGACKSGLCLTRIVFRPGSFNDQLCTPGANQCPTGWGCHRDPSRGANYCAEEQNHCTRLCQNNTHCSGGTASNPLTQCSSNIQVELSDGTATNVTVCSQP